MSWDWEKLKQQQRAKAVSLPKWMKWSSSSRNFRLPGGPLALGIILVALLALTTFYTVNQDEVGIVQRFGRYIETPSRVFEFLNCLWASTPSPKSMSSAYKRRNSGRPWPRSTSGREPRPAPTRRP